MAGKAAFAVAPAARPPLALNAAVEHPVQQTRRGARIGKASDRLRNDALIALTLVQKRRP